MRTIHFTARLLGDAVISERASTTGGHRCLDHIPGACLLGAAASRIYAELGSDAFTVFHSGKVRFGTAYPLDTKGHSTLPLPLSWHCAKGEDMGGSVTGVKNLIHATREDFEGWDKEGVQQKQLRSGFFSATGELVQPAKRYRLKTAIAIDREKGGMAEEGQLFGYEALAAGTLWHFTVAFDDDVPAALDSKVAAALSGRFRIGRSRSAEYGLLEAETVVLEKDSHTPEACEQLVLYCASDLALSDPSAGCPVLVPTGGLIGLPDAELSVEKSYIRVRSYAPFNAARRRFDLERQVIAKGSVLVFTNKGGFSSDDLTALSKRLESGVGLYRQDGLGILLVNPPFLAGFGFPASDAAPSLSIPSRKDPGAPPPLADWLSAKTDEQAREVAAVERVEEWIDALVRGDACPKNSQWGNLRNIAVRADSVDKIRAEVEKLCSKGVSQKQWEKKFNLNGSRVGYGKFLVETVLPKGIALEEARRRLYLLGNRLPRRINQKEGGVR